MVVPSSSMDDEPCIGLPIDIDSTSLLKPSNHTSAAESQVEDARDTSHSQQLQLSPCIGPAIDAIEATDATSPPPIQPQSPSALEDRVEELEEKLATLSLLLQRQNRRLRSVSPPSITPPASPPDAMVALESPHPLRPTVEPVGRRNLSFRVLHGDSSREGSSDLEDIAAAAMAAERAQGSMLYLSEDLKNGPAISLVKKTSLLSPIASPDVSGITTVTSINGDSSNKERKDVSRNDSSTKKGGSGDGESKWYDYLNSFQESNYDTDKQMEEFVKVPSAVEALLSFGFWICVDSFLYILTILPIRFVWSLLLLVRFLCFRVAYGEVPEGPFRFHRRHSYQLIQVSIIYTIYKYVLLPISIGKFYHWIRGQAMVKLYVLIAIVEVFDRLMCSLGQDCLDSLYWNTTRRPRSSRLIVSVVVVLTYTMVHSFLLFVHVATLNVAMNSDDQALISLLIGGNFAEIKSTVFKKYNKGNLFKIAASDICERFKLALFLALVLALNMSQGMDEKMVMNYVQMCGVVWCAEWLSDWIKHSFITKFNYLSSSVYPEYGVLLAGDVTGIGHEGVNLDYSHAVVKRIGFAQLPLVCVMTRYLKEAFKYATYEKHPSKLMVGVGFLAIWSVLLVCKLSLGSFLQRICHARVEAFKKTVMTTKKKKN